MSKRNCFSRHASVALFLISIVLSVQPIPAIGSDISKAKQLIENDGQYEKAMLLLKKEMKRKPGNARTWYWMAIARSEVFKYKRVSEEHKKVILEMGKAFSLGLAKPLHKRGYSVWGWSDFYLRNNQQALEKFNQALSIDPNYYSALRGRGFVYWGMSDYKRALPAFNYCLEKRSDDKLVLYQRGWAHFYLGNYKKALFDFNATLLSTVSTTEEQRILSARGWTYFHLSQFDTAYAEFKKSSSIVAKKSPQDLQNVSRGLAFSLLGLRRYDEVISLLKEAKAANALYPREKKDLALVHYVMGNKKKAIEYWGGPGRFGARTERFNKNGNSGVMIPMDDSPSGPALKAGLKPGDVITSLDGQAVNNKRKFIDKIVRSSPGSKRVLEILRHGKRYEKMLIVGSAENAMQENKLIAGMLGKRKQGKSMSKVKPDQDQSVDAQPILEIENVLLESVNIKAGSLIKVEIEILLDVPSQDKSTLEAILNYGFAQNGRILKQFKPEKIDLSNGESVTLIKKSRAARKKGDYQIYIEVVYKGIKTKQKVDFSII